jgi:hypothetical protein
MYLALSSTVYRVFREEEGDVCHMIDAVAVFEIITKGAHVDEK